MSKHKIKKTNAMRELDKAHIEYEVREYEVDENLSGVHAAESLGEDPKKVFKTLVARSNTNEFCVFMIPVADELDLKKAASASSNKSIHMLAVKELKDVTGYIRGGCSPLAMKKKFPSYIDQSACKHDYIACSAGQRGLQLIVNPLQLAKLIQAEFADLRLGL